VDSGKKARTTTPDVAGQVFALRRGLSCSDLARFCWLEPSPLQRRFAQEAEGQDCHPRDCRETEWFKAGSDGKRALTIEPACADRVQARRGL